MSATPKQLGKYELQERLGQGGMAEVWKAFDPQLKRYVAIKFMHTNLRSDPDFVKRFVREGQAIASLRHPNIVQVYDFEIAPEDDDGPMAYMIMDYIEGQTLAKYIRETSFAGKFPSNAEIVHLFTSICLAVDYAHQNHIIHRDIKPANILLDARNKQRNPMGEPILTDFGIVKMLGAATLTSTGMSLGTPLYISPEQVQGQPGNEKSDIYALGVMLYEICAGKPAFEGDSAYGIMVQRLHTVPMPVSQVNPNMPPELDDVIFRCLAKDPQARFASASMLAIALANALKVPVLEQISLSGIAADPADLPTFFSPLDRASNPGLAPNTPSNQGANRPSNQGVVADRASNPGYATNNPSSQGYASDRPSNQGYVPNNPSNPGSGNDAFLQEMQNKLETLRAGANTPTSQAVVPATLLHRDHDIPVEGRVIVTPEDRFVATPPRPQKRRKGLMVAVVVIALLALIGSGTYIFLSARGIGTAGTNIVGTASFFSSRQLNGQGMPGINDGVQVHLQNLSNPAAGNNYYVWLRNDKVETESVYLGVLKINQGTATLTYTDSQHRDLLADMDNFLVTEESAAPVPNQPTLQQANWRYSASLPSTKSNRDNFSYLDHLRHLLSTEPDLAKLGLNGGVDYWFLNNIQEMQKQAMEVKDH
ncbi:MAG TPA: serine/threonine-protein kinase, partial [Ktedonobacteraceae bacterium]|nr:serine/threonine-protein kinase [Ktedonobacteraceae bacterium]